MAVIPWDYALRGPAQAMFTPAVAKARHVMLDDSEEQTIRGRRWHAVLTWPNLSQAQMYGLRGHFEQALEGDQLNIPCFDYWENAGTKAGSVLLSGSHPAGSTTLTFTGGTGEYRAGDRRHFGGQTTRVWMHEVRQGEDTSGPGTIAVWPPLLTTWADATPLNGEAMEPLGLSLGGAVIETMVLTEEGLAFPPLQPASPNLFSGWSVELVSFR